MSQDGPPPDPDAISFELDTDGPPQAAPPAAEAPPAAAPPPGPPAGGPTGAVPPTVPDAREALPSASGVTVETSDLGKKPIQVPPASDPEPFFTTTKIVGLLAIVALVVVGWLMFAPDHLPKMTLPTNHEGALPVDEVIGERTGVILYLSAMPDNRHEPMLKSSIETVEALASSNKYDVRLVFGANELTVAQSALDGVETTVFMDPGKKLAKELDITYAGIVYFDKDGAIEKQVNEGFLKTKIEVDDHLDVIRDQM